MGCTIVAQVLGRGNKPHLTFDGEPLDYSLFIDNFCQYQHMIDNPIVELDLLIRSCMGQTEPSTEWHALGPVASHGLAEALSTIARDFGNTTVLTCAFMHKMLGISDKTKL